MKQTKRRWIPVWISVILAFALIAAACGDDDDDAGSDNEGTTESADTTDPEPDADDSSDQEDEAEADPEPDDPEPTPEPEVDLGDQVVIASYGGSFQEAQTVAYFDPFAAVSGVEVIGTEGSSIDRVRAMVETNQVEWDVVSSESAPYVILGEEGSLEPIDYSVVQADGVPEQLRGEFGVGYLTFGLNLAWSNELFPDGLTPAEFFDPTVEARRAMNPSPSFVLEFALIADGVAPADLYPLDVDRAFEVLDRIKDQVVAFRGSGDLQNLVQQGEIDAAYIPNGRVEDAIDSGADWSYSWEGAVADTEYWIVPRGAPNVTGAMAFIDYATSAQPQADMSEAILYGPTNTNAFEFIGAERAGRLPGQPEFADVSAVLNSQWWSENRDAVVERFDAWLLE